jgi:hypothetical protein
MKDYEDVGRFRTDAFTFSILFRCVSLNVWNFKRIFPYFYLSRVKEKDARKVGNSFRLMEGQLWFWLWTRMVNSIDISFKNETDACYKAYKHACIYGDDQLDYSIQSNRNAHKVKSTINKC